MARRTHTTKDFGDVVRRARLKAGLSQSEAARRAAITQPYLSRIEGGDAEPPSVDVIERIADAIGLPKLRLFIAAGIMPEEVEQAFFDSPGLFSLLANLKRAQRGTLYKRLKQEFPSFVDGDAEAYAKWLKDLVERLEDP